MTAAANEFDNALNTLAALLARSLLQYLDDARPWSAHHEMLDTLATMAQQQRSCFFAVLALLNERRVLPDLGNFPAEFPSLHFLSLDYLIDRLVINQLAVVAAVDSVLLACPAGQPRSRLNQVFEQEAEHLKKLRGMDEALHRHVPSPATIAGLPHAP